MGIELRPLGIQCNISCRYCYQHPQRSIEKKEKEYSIEKMKEALLKQGEKFTLFGGEPLLMPMEDLEEMLHWGYEQFKGTTIQTNGTLISDAHLELFKKYNVDLGISIDGPDELNDVRWYKSLDATRQMTKKLEETIEKLCSIGIVPGLIVTLHKGNAVGDSLTKMVDWVRALDDLGIQSIRLHLLEVDAETVRDSFAMSIEENITALLEFINVEKKLKHIRFDITGEIRSLLLGKDQQVSCVWRACDPFNTPSVRGIEGFGQESKCGRVNKDGIDYMRPDTVSYERYLHLYNTPYDMGGCQGCRFFLMCKGNCPGTALDGDWRNRSEHCGVWRYLFSHVEQELILGGETPLSVHPVRETLERNMVKSWKKGYNPPISRLSWKDFDSLQHAQYQVFRRIWKNEIDKGLWEPRINRVITMVQTVLTLNDSDLKSDFLTGNSGHFLWELSSEEHQKISEEIKRRGFDQELEWFSEIVSWKQKTSIHNGLLETETPYFKIVKKD